MISAIKEDIYRYHGGNYNKLTIKLVYLYEPYTRYMYFFRKAQFAKNRFSKQFWCILLKNLKYTSGGQIPAGTRIGRGFRLLHFGSVVVHPNSVIGHNL